MNSDDSRPDMQVTEPGDSLPEYHKYHDEGCTLFPSCLECPLSRCRYDEQAGGQRMALKLRNREVMRQRTEEGKGTAELARIFGVSTRTVQRIITNYKEEQS